MKTYTAEDVELFTHGKTEAMGFETGEVKVRVCLQCGKACFVLPEAVRRLMATGAMT
jgi:hypothetical protein